MVQVNSELPLWVSVPTVSIPVFIGTRSIDPYGHTFYEYFTGTSAHSLRRIAVSDPEAVEIANMTSNMLLPFVDPVALVPFVAFAKMKIAHFGLPRREHIILTINDYTERWWLYAPVAEVNKLVIDGVEVTPEVANGIIYVNGQQVNQLISGGKSELTIYANSIEIHYAIGKQFPMIEDAIPYFVAAAYLRAASERDSGIYESIRVGAVSFSFRPIRELREKAIQLEKTGLQILRAGGVA